MRERYFYLRKNYGSLNSKFLPCLIWVNYAQVPKLDPTNTVTFLIEMMTENQLNWNVFVRWLIQKRWHRWR